MKYTPPTLLVLLLLLPRCGASPDTRATDIPAQTDFSTIVQADNPTGDAPDQLATISPDEQTAGEVESPLYLGRGWLGIVLREIEREEAIAMGFNRTLVEVEQVFPDTPAARSDFQEGDLVLRFDGTDLVNASDLVGRVGATPPGTVVAVHLERDGQRIDQQVMLGVRPETDELVRSILVDRQAPPVTVSVVSDGDLADGENTHNQLMTLEDQAGQIVVLDFWATWCGPCRRALPEIDDLSRRYADRGVSVIGISDEEQSVLERFLADHPVGYIIGQDAESATTRSCFITAYPTLLLIDRSGVVREVFIGGTEIPDLEMRLLELLEE